MTDKNRSLSDILADLVDYQGPRERLDEAVAAAQRSFDVLVSEAETDLALAFGGEELDKDKDQHLIALLTLRVLARRYGTVTERTLLMSKVTTNLCVMKNWKD